MGLRPPCALLGIVLAGTLAGCGNGDAWGPLAVVDDSDFTGGGQEGLDGVLRIEESCVVVETTTGFEVTLVWPESRTEWDDAGGSIRFRSSEGSLELDDGTELSIGGGEAASTDFVAAPAESCPDERFLVSDVRAGG